MFQRLGMITISNSMQIQVLKDSLFRQCLVVTRTGVPIASSYAERRSSDPRLVGKSD